MHGTAPSKAQKMHTNRLKIQPVMHGTKQRTQFQLEVNFSNRKIQNNSILIIFFFMFPAADKGNQKAKEGCEKTCDTAKAGYNKGKETADEAGKYIK